MPTDQPSNTATRDIADQGTADEGTADKGTGADARDDRTAADVLTDAPLDGVPGGGGLGGQGAAPPHATGGAAPNAPLAGALNGAGEDEAGSEARGRAAADTDARHPGPL